MFSTPALLTSEPWVCWNGAQWGLTPTRVCYPVSGRSDAGMEGWLYLDGRGRVRMPPRNPYLSLRCLGSPTRLNSRRYRQWMSVSKLFAEDLRSRGVHGSIALPPGLVDGRAMNWAGFSIGVRYTTIVPLPLDLSSLDKSVKRDVRKAQAMGYTVEEDGDLDAICYCLGRSESRKRFSLKIDRGDLEECIARTGAASVRAFVARDRCSTPVCAILTLFEPGCTALGWASGTETNHLRNGVMQLTRLKTLTTLQTDGASDFDFCGSNLDTVAAAKANWGGPLVPYITIQQPGVRAVARSIRDAMRWRGLLRDR